MMRFVSNQVCCPVYVCVSASVFLPLYYCFWNNLFSFSLSPSRHPQKSISISLLPYFLPSHHLLSFLLSFFLGFFPFPFPCFFNYFLFPYFHTYLLSSSFLPSVLYSNLIFLCPSFLL